MIIFRLTMVKVPTWDGTWSGADKVFVRRRLDSVVPASVVGRVFTYEWDDGWSVRISVEKVSTVEAIGIAKQSKGFCGYDWMIDSIIKYGEILDERGRAKKDGYFFYNGEYLSPEDVAVRLTEYKDKIAELEGKVNHNALWQASVDAEERAHLEKLVSSLKARIAELSQAVGLITTLKPTMVMDTEHPLDMAKEVAEYVTARIGELEAENERLSQLLHDEMSQLEIATDLGNKRWAALNKIYEDGEKHNTNWCKRIVQEGLGIK